MLKHQPASTPRRFARPTALSLCNTVLHMTRPSSCRGFPWSTAPSKLTLILCPPAASSDCISTGHPTGPR